jgi:hypothetical protein
VTELDETEAQSEGVKQVGAHAASEPARPDTKRAARARQAQPVGERIPGNLLLIGLAVLGLLGTLVFGVLYFAKSSGSSLAQDPSAKAAVQTFLTDLFNFNAKSIDTDFASVSNMATGKFSTQADQFFNSAIRQELERALADSRGQIRDLQLQSENAAETTAEYYAVVDEVYVNNKITTPQSDQVRIIVDLAKVNSVWKVSDVTVLEGATPASAGSASGSAGSDVPGQ